MATKDKLENLVNGVVNETPTPSPVPEQETIAVKVDTLTELDLDALNLTQEQRAKLDALRASKKGRPKGKLVKRVPSDRATFIVPRQLTQKLKLIALYETRLYKDVVADALTKYVADYEATHGRKIELKPIGD